MDCMDHPVLLAEDSHQQFTTSRPHLCEHHPTSHTDTAEAAALSNLQTLKATPRPSFRLKINYKSPS